MIKYRDLPKFWKVVVRSTDQKVLLKEHHFDKNWKLAWYLLTTSFDDLANVEIYWTRKRVSTKSPKRKGEQVGPKVIDLGSGE